MILSYIKKEGNIVKELGNIPYRRNSIIWSALLLIVFIFQNGDLGNYPVLILLIPIFFWGPKYFIKLGRMQIFLVIYWIYLTFITLVNIKSNYDVKNAIFILIQYVVCFLACFFTIQKVNVNKIFCYLRNIGIVLAILGVLEGLVQYPFFSYVLNKNYSELNEYRIRSIFDHPIVCGCGLLFFWCLLLLYPLKNYYYNIFASIIIVAAIILTRARSIWLAAIVVFVLYYYKIKGIRKISIQKNKLLFVIILAIVSFVVFLVIFRVNIIIYIYEFIASRWTGMLDAGEGQIIRIETVMNSIEYWSDGNFLKMIFGMGKNYDKIFMKMFPIIKWGIVLWDTCLDNQYFTILHESGIVGLISILLILRESLRRLKKVSKESREVIVTALFIIGFSVAIFFFEGLNYIVLVVIYILCIVVNDNFYGKLDKGE